MNISRPNEANGANGAALEIAWSPEVVAALASLGVPAAALDMPTPGAPPPAHDKGNGKGRANGKGNGAHRAAPQNWIELPDGQTIHESELIPLWRDDYTDPQKTHLIVKDGDSYHIDPRGFPLVLAYTSPEQCERGTASEAVRITLCWSNTREIYGEQIVSAKDIATNDYFACFGLPAYSARGEQARIANVLKAQIPHLPKRLTPAASGWSRAPSGAPRFVLEDRTSWWMISEDGEPRIDGPAIAPPIPTAADAAYLVNTWSSWGPDGRGVAALAFAVRGLFASLKPVGTSLVLTGATGSSKTTAGRFALGILGAVKQDATPTLTFTASAAAMKAKRSWRNDLPSLFDDFHKLANEGGLARMFDALDAIFRAIADGDEWNARGTRTGGLREPVYLRGADIFTGEMIDGLLASAERRMAWIGYPDDLNSDDIYVQWDVLQKIWEGVGHAVIRWALPIFAEPGGRDKLAGYLGKLDQSGTDAIFDVLARARPQAPHKFVRSIARNWAPILSGAIIADRAIGAEDGDGPFTETLRQTLAGLALRQLDRLAGGASATAEFDLEWFRRVYEQFVSSGDYLLADAETGRPFQSFEAADASWLMGIGYRWRSEAGFAGFVPNAKQHGGWRHRTNGEDWPDPGQFLSMCERRAKSLGSTFPFNRQTLAAHLRRIGLTLEGNEGNLHKPYIPHSDPRYPDKGSQPRVFRVPFIDPAYSAETAGRDGRPGDPQVSNCNIENIVLPALSPGFSRLAESRETATAEAGRRNNQLNQSVNTVSPGLPSLPAKNDAPIEPGDRAGRESRVPPSTPPAALVVAERGPGEADGPFFHLSMAPGATPGSKPLVFLISPRLAATLQNPAGPCCPVRRPQMPQDSLSPSAPAEPPQPRKAPGEAPTAPGEAPMAARHRRRAFTASAAQSRGGLIVALDATKVAVADKAGTIVIEAHGDATNPASAKKTGRGRTKAPGAALSAALDWTKAKGSGKLSITRPWTTAAGLPDIKFLSKDGLDHPFAVLPDDSAWTLDKPGKLKRSMKARHKGSGWSIDIEFPCYNPDAHLGEGSAEELVRTLSMFRTATATSSRPGFTWRYSSGSAFVDMWEMLSKDLGAVDITSDLAPANYPPPSRLIPEPAADIAWTRAPLDTEQNARSCIVIDGNSQYLRAMAGMVCGVGLPEHVEKPAFDKQRPGYWRARYRADAWPATLPDPGWPLEPGEQGWLMTETVAFLIEIGATVEIAEAELWQGARALDRLQARLRDALYFLTDEKAKGTPGATGALSQIKLAPKQGVGRWSRQEDRKLATPEFRYRPHWRHAVIARSTASLLRDLRTKTGDAHPMAIDVDAFAFLTDEDNPAAAASGLGLPIGTRLGQYKVKRFFEARPLIEALGELHNPATAKDEKRLSAARAAVGGLISGKDKADG
jgi:hypothetical protein